MLSIFLSVSLGGVIGASIVLWGPKGYKAVKSIIAGGGGTGEERK